MLVKADLAADLTTLFNAPPATRADCASAWTDAYADYASTAVSCSGGSPLAPGIALAKVTLQVALLAAFAGTDASSTAASMSAAFSAFWLLPPLTFSGPTPGAVVAVAGTAILQAGLLAAWANNVATNASAADAASAHADVLHAFTTTVVVLHAPPSVCTGPIS